MRILAAGYSLAVGFLALAGPIVPVGQDSGPPTSEDVIFVHVCDQDAPEQWTVIEEASARSDKFVQCNFRAGPTAGVAVSIEYYCTAAEAREAFLGKTGDRDTEVRRSPTKLVLEEGPDAETEAGRERPFIESSFFPGVLFPLQQKEFLLVDDQTVATIVVNTTNRIVSIDGGAELAALTVATNHTPESQPGCEFAGVPAGAGGAPADSRGGGGRIGIVLGGAAVVTVGGVVVWRRGKKPGRVVPKPELGHVPPQCVAQQQAFEHVRERLITLQEAFQDMNEHLARAEKNHHINKLRTIAILGIDAGTTIGGAVGSAVSMRPSARRPLPAQADTWRPPVNLDPRLANVLRRAGEAVEAAAARVAAARRAVAELGQKLADVANMPAVRTARERAAALGAAVERATAGLAGSSAARQAIDTLDDKITRYSAMAAENAERARGLERMAERQRGWLTGATDDLAKLTDTVDGPAAGSPRLGPVNPKIDASKASVARLQADLDKTLADLSSANLNAADATKGVESLVSQRDAELRNLAKHGDVLDRDVERLREQHSRAVAEASTAHLQTASDLDRRNRAARAALARAEAEESLAKTFQQNVGAQIDLRTMTPPPGLARKVLHGATELVTLPFLPVLWIFEKGFGSVQSLPEAVEILIRGEQRVVELTRQLTMVERAITQQRIEAQRTRTVLDQCVQQWSGAA